MNEQKQYLRSGSLNRRHEVRVRGMGFEEVAERDIFESSPARFPCGSAQLICSIAET